MLIRGMIESFHANVCRSSRYMRSSATLSSKINASLVSRRLRWSISRLASSSCPYRSRSRSMEKYSRSLSLAPPEPSVKVENPACRKPREGGAQSYSAEIKSFWDMVLTLSRQDVEDFSRENQYAMMMFMDAGFDYNAARCCVLNALHSGFRLASDSVEKLLKAHSTLTIL